MFARLVPLFALLLALPGRATQDDEMLRVVQARFVPAQAAPGATVRLEVELEALPGYHVYGQKETAGGPPRMSLSQAQGLVAKGKPQFPDGKPHEQYGMVSWWVTGKAVLSQDWVVPENASGELVVRGSIDGQVCDDRMCYPVEGLAFDAKLQIAAAAPAEPESEEDAAPIAGAGGIGLPGLEVAEDLTAEPGLQPARVRPGEVAVLRVSVVPPLGKHVYGADVKTGIPTELEIVDPAGTQPLGPAQVPSGVPHEGESWLEEPFDVVQRIHVPEGLEPGERTLIAKLSYQICDDRTCWPAAERELRVALVVEAGAVRSEFAPSDADREWITGKKAAPPPDEPQIEAGGGAAGGNAGDSEGTDGRDLLGFLLLAIGGGLFALVMPCTYPMIPITISFFTKQAESRHSSVLPLSLTYGLGIVLIFVLIGIVFGPAIIPFAAHWITNLLIGIVFFVFALSLFGVFTLQPPKFLMNAASKASMQGGYLGVFLMGATLVVTSFTCTAPFVGTLLAAGASQGLGRLALGMAVFGLTMAIPFVVLSMLPSKIKSMPRSGNWMNTLKVVLGFIEVAAAFKFISNAELALHLQILPRELFLLLWFGIFGIAALYLLGLINLKGEAAAGIGPGRMSWALVILMFAFYCLFGAMGNRLDWIMTAMAPPYSAGRTYAAAGVPVEVKYPDADREHGGQHLVFNDDYEAARKAAIKENRLLLVNFTGHT